MENLLKKSWFTWLVVTGVLGVILVVGKKLPFFHRSESIQEKPNIVFILTDDLDARSIAYMPNLQSLLIKQGLSFSRFYVNVSLCCPSRSSILRGQYAHNHGVLTNKLPQGGFGRFHELGNEDSTIATWLHDAGYQTALMGKYLNGYPNGVNKTYIPPGWSEWVSPAEGNAYRNFNYTLNENGTLVSYGHNPQDYLTDVLSRKSEEFIRKSASEHNPFFLYLSTYAPHGPSTEAPRHESLFNDVSAPQDPSFNEADMSDKPLRRPKLTQAQQVRIDQRYRDRLRSLQAVDETIAALIDVLSQTGQLEQTYIFFSSDNGYHLGQHRMMEGKNTAYEEDILVPLVVRGPNVPAGRTIDILAGNIDFAPTFAQLARVTPPVFIDGISLVPFIHVNPPINPREAFLIEHHSDLVPKRLAKRNGDELEEPSDQDELDIHSPSGFRKPPAFEGIRTKKYLYVEYDTGDRELYDVERDPFELENVYRSADKSIIEHLSALLDKLKDCRSESCR